MSEHKIELTINGRKQQATVEGRKTLCDFLRVDAGCTGVHVGCEHGVCGACTVIVDGQALRSCTTPVSTVVGKKIVTLESLGTAERPGPLQKAFIAEQAAQCGYCVAGMLMSAQALLDRNPRPTEAQIRLALAGNLCRCGTHNRIVRAVQRAAKEMAA